jgi:hypothetical protein
MIFGKIIRLNLFVEKPTPPSLSERYGSLTSFVVEGYSFIHSVYVEIKSSFVDLYGNIDDGSCFL